MSDLHVPTPEVITKENLRAVSRGRALGYGITLLFFAFLEFIWFARAPRHLQTTVQFGLNSATHVPNLNLANRIAVAVIGLALLSVTNRVLHSRRTKTLSYLVGALLLAWVALLVGGANGANGQLRTLTLPVAMSSVVVGVVTVLGGAWLAYRRFSRGAGALLYGGLVCFLLDFLLWVARGSNQTGLDLQITGILAAAFLAATPLMFGSLSGTLCERSGVVNIAIEGQFMFGALGSIMVASAMRGTHISMLLGVLIAGLIGALIGWLLAFMALHYGADQIIVGVVIVAFCTAMSQFLVSQVLDSRQWLNVGYSLPVLKIPVLAQIPVLGPILFDQNVLVYVAIFGVALANVSLFRTRWGLRVRSVGEKPLAAETVGVDPIRVRYSAVIVGGFVAGLGGAAFTLGPGSPFSFGMTSGYGYIALAIMIFGRWRPWGALSASLLFGFTISLSSNLNIYISQLVIPSQLISALPYLITIAAVSGLVGRIRPPAADGTPYKKG